MRLKLIYVYCFYLLSNLLFANETTDKNLVFHFNFENAAKKKIITDQTGNYNCISKKHNFAIQQKALRVAPCSNIYIPAEKLPDISKEVTVSAWILKKSTPDVTPILMKGEHPNPIEFIFSVGWRYPVFMYKNINPQDFWKGIYYKGDFGTRIYYPNPNWHVPGTELIESSGYWKNITSVFNKGNIKIFINGILTAQMKSPKPEFLKRNNSPIYIGAERLKNEDLNFRSADMLINDIRLYNKAISNDAVKNIFKSDKKKYPLGCLIPKGNTHLNALAPCKAYPFNKNYDPEMKHRLKITEEYENQKQKIASKFDKIAESSIENINGIPTLTINGKKESSLQVIPASFIHADGFYRLKETYECIRDFAAAGIEKKSIKVDHEMWIGEGKYDWAHTDNLMRNSIKADPTIKIMPYIYIGIPNWFKEAYPDELEKCWQGNKLRTESRGGPLGSMKWLDVSKRAIKDIVKHIETSDYSQNIYGYLIGGGGSAEWYWAGGAIGGLEMGGYSKGTEQTFRQWLKKKYINNDKLQRSWKDKTVTFENATVPTVEFRKASELFIFRDISKAAQVFDFRKFMTDQTVLHITEAAKAVKEASDYKKIVNTYGGYPLSCSPKKLAANGRQGASSIFASPYIDTLSTPIDYRTRRAGGAAMNVNGFNGTAYLHNKIIWHENDLRTHLCNKIESSRTSTLAETISVIERGFGNAFIRNQALWWYPFDNAWFHQEKTMRTIEKINNIANESLTKDRTRAAEVALIFDENSLYYLSYNSGDFIKKLNWQTYESAARTGAPFDVYLLDDIKNPKMPDYKLYIFMNTFYSNPSIEKTISQKVKRNNSVAVWSYAPGFINDNGFNTSSMKSLTGINIKVVRNKVKAKLNIVKSRHTICQYADKNKTFKFGPFFYTDDLQAETLGTVNGKPALVVKDLGKWRSVYSLMPLTKELLKGLCDYAGVHVYTDGFDVFSANKSYMMLHSSTSGDKTIILPEKSTVKDLLSNKIIGDCIQSFTIKNMPAGKTKIFGTIK